jgi:mRNA degradation ribonuclease J1/J2
VVPFDPNSIDGIIMKRTKRRLLRERLSMLFAGVVVTVMLVTFYSILTG